jgi:hypothetical protein
MHVLMIRNLEEDQQGHGNVQCVKAEKLRRRQQEGVQVTTRLQLHLRIQDQFTLKLTPRMHTDYVFNVLYMDGKVRR